MLPAGWEQYRVLSAGHNWLERAVLTQIVLYMLVCILCSEPKFLDNVLRSIEHLKD